MVDEIFYLKKTNGYRVIVLALLLRMVDINVLTFVCRNKLFEESQHEKNIHR